MKRVLLVHYTEIGTKGRNRSFFERRLREDIQARLGPQAAKVRLERGRVVAELAASFDEAAVVRAFDRVFGVAWFAFAEEVPREWPAVLEAGLRAAEAGKSARAFKVYVNRVDKTFPLSSQEVCNRLGKAVVEKFGLKVDLENHDLSVHVEILPGEALVYSERRPGLRGLPRASSGRLLCLFSGGIDSPVAAWSLMRRGAVVHLLHFHPFRTAEEVRGTKILPLYETLKAYNPSSRLYLIPHYHYQVKAALEVPAAHEMVLFRRFMFRTAAELAKRKRMKGLITGDSLGQVASQTVENIAAAQSDLSAPVFLPLISQDKDDIIRTAKRIGTYEASILPYKDCCSLMSRHPKTMARVDEIRRLEEKLDFAPLIEESLKAAEVLKADGSFAPLRQGPLSTVGS
jgi:tRNA uracil 4-sulfurtransferase